MAKYALISPHESKVQGYRVVETTNKKFDVAEPLFWIQCRDELKADQAWYDPKLKVIKDIEQPSNTAKPTGGNPVKPAPKSKPKKPPNVIA